jgi:8-oxo-dGTP pyrophosphatase MutT (NUDIX family)
MNDQNGITDIIRETLNSREPKLINDAPSSYIHAGVLIPLLEEGGVHKVLFTERTDIVEHHKSEISFPGGAAEKRDRSIEETALREACEEIGLLRKDVEILGRIDGILTLGSNFVVHPFVGLIPCPYDFIINTAEVKRIIKVPLIVFDPNNLEAKRHTVESAGMSYQPPTYEYNGDLIWGATARMMENFVNIIDHKWTLFEDNK